MLESLSTMKDWIHQYYGSGWFLIISVVCYIFLFCESKEWKEKLVYPVLFLLFILLNPLLYKILFVSTRYVRWFWMLPNLYVVAAAIIKMLQKLNRKWEQVLIFIGFTVAIVFVGSFAYYSDKYSKTQNEYKLDQEIVDICDLILERDEDPKCIFGYPLYNRVRQISGDIKMFYGRDANGYIMKATDLQKEIFNQMMSASPDYDRILEVAVQEECEFITTPKTKAIGEETLKTYQFVQIAETKNYFVYQYQGKP